MKVDFAQVSGEYTRLWASMTVRADKAAEISAIARGLYASKPRYAAVSAKTGVPWFIIAAIHERESSQNFNTQLAQGDPLNHLSIHVPRNMGPYIGPQAWENAAVDALRLDKLDKVSPWTAERACYELELYNGFGYRAHGINSPYLWSFTSNYSVGKYVADGVWDAGAVDKQCGTIPIVKALMQMDQATWPKPVPYVPPTPPQVQTNKHVAAGGAGAAAATAAHASGLPLWTIIAIALATAAITWIVIHTISKTT